MFFVYYNYDYDEMGGKGMSWFNTKDDALNFIMERRKNMRHNENMSEVEELNEAFTIIQGKGLKIEEVSRVTEFKIV